MVKLRLSRVGTHKRPYYWIVAADSECPRDGRYLEKLGTYDPTSNPRTSNVKLDRVNYWLDNGATPTLVVRKLLRDQGLWKTRKEAKSPAPAEAAVS